ncbi:heavy metal transporter [Sulfolobus sp. SCGC AB-777_L09]|nr:heavy metal transporter [Sulfolobus sp. SCGC AB-777_L09]
MQEISFKVSGIYCENCVRRVYKALSTLKGVIDIQILPNFDKGYAEVHLKCEKKTHKEEIEDVINEISQETPYHEYRVIWVKHRAFF